MQKYWPSSVAGTHFHLHENSAKKHVSRHSKNMIAKNIARYKSWIKKQHGKTNMTWSDRYFSGPMRALPETHMTFIVSEMPLETEWKQESWQCMIYDGVVPELKMPRSLIAIVIRYLRFKALNPTKFILFPTCGPDRQIWSSAQGEEPLPSQGCTFLLRKTIIYVETCDAMYWGRAGGGSSQHLAHIWRNLRKGYGSPTIDFEVWKLQLVTSQIRRWTSHQRCRSSHASEFEASSSAMNPLSLAMGSAWRCNLCILTVWTNTDN